MPDLRVHLDPTVLPDRLHFERRFELGRFRFSFTDANEVEVQALGDTAVEVGAEEYRYLRVTLRRTQEGQWMATDGHFGRRVRKPRVQLTGRFAEPIRLALVTEIEHLLAEDPRIVALASIVAKHTECRRLADAREESLRRLRELQDERAQLESYGSPVAAADAADAPDTVPTALGPGRLTVRNARYVTVRLGAFSVGRKSLLGAEFTFERTPAGAWVPQFSPTLAVRRGQRTAIELFNKVRDAVQPEMLEWLRAHDTLLVPARDAERQTRLEALRAEIPTVEAEMAAAAAAASVPTVVTEDEVNALLMSPTAGVRDAALRYLGTGEVVQPQSSPPVLDASGQWRMPL